MDIYFNDPKVLAAMLSIVVLAILAIVWIAASRSRKRTAQLRARFGAEYDFCVREERSRRKAEAKLLSRIRRVQSLKTRSLTPAEFNHFQMEWEAVQARFLDHPRGAVTEADELVNAVMMARGFPVGRFEQRAADLSVDHARLVQAYRSANAITVRVGSNEATTEELRTAMIHYRALFDELLGVASSPIERRAVA